MAATCSKARAPGRHRRSCRHSDDERLRSFPDSSAIGFRVGKCGCTSSPPAPVAAPQTSCASTAFRRRHLSPLGKPRWPSARANDWGWQSRSRRYLCLRAVCVHRCRTWALATLAFRLRRAAGLIRFHRHRTARQSPCRELARSRECDRCRGPARRIRLPGPGRSHRESASSLVRPMSAPFQQLQRL